MMQLIKGTRDPSICCSRSIVSAADKSPNRLLATKLNRPAPDDKNILRPRLISFLDAGTAKRITVISAPAGFGKTTLVAQWLYRCGMASAWLSLDASDNDPERFLRYIIAAIRIVDPGFGSGIEPLLAPASLPPPDYLADAMLSAMTALREPVVLVLDDYHAISSSAVHQIVSRMVEYLPVNMRLVVMTRRDPPWKLGRWRGQQWLRELKNAAIAFTEEETCSFLQGYGLTEDSIRIIHKRTEGWITALQLVSLSLKDADDPVQFVKRFSDSDRMIIDYLMEEVIAPLPSRVLDFLAVTALLDRFCNSLCNALLSEESDRWDSRQLIALMEQENLFLVPLDNERCWYRHHHLFRNLLRHHLKENLDTERQATLHVRAGMWFAGHGLIEEGLWHFLLAGDVNAAAALVGENLHAAIDEDRSRKVLGRWLNMFPAHELERHPSLMMAKAYERMAYWDFPAVTTFADRADALLQKPSAAASKDSRNRLRPDIDVLRCFCLSWLGDAEGGLRHALRALKGIPVSHNYAYTLVKTYAAAACASTGRLADALEQLDQYFAQDFSRGGRNAADILISRCVNLVSAGELDAVCQTAERMLTLEETNPACGYYNGYARYFLALVAYERNRLDIAAGYLSHIREMRYQVNTRLYFESLVGMALVAQAQGDQIKAGQYLSEARAFAVETQNANSFVVLNAFEIQRSLCLGSVPQGMPMQVPVYERYMVWLENLPLLNTEYLVHCRLPGNGRSALRMIEDAKQDAKKHHINYRVIQLQALQAMVLHRLGNSGDARQLLEKTLRMAQPHGMVRSFLNRGLPMADLMKSLSRINSQDAYLKSLLAAFDREPLKDGSLLRDSEASPVPPEVMNLPGASEKALSNRETDVMILLEERLSSKEIAQRLFISPETVRKHISNIFRKLQAHNRRQAVSSAKKLNLLPSR